MKNKSPFNYKIHYINEYDDPIITPNEWCEDEKELRLSQCDPMFQDYYNGPESLHAMGCINAVYVSDGMVVYPDGTTGEA
jgi:hypothetical protein